MSVTPAPRSMLVGTYPRLPFATDSESAMESQLPVHASTPNMLRTGHRVLPTASCQRCCGGSRWQWSRTRRDENDH